jgi:hypothetical protein
MRSQNADNPHQKITDRDGLSQAERAILGHTQALLLEERNALTFAVSEPANPYQMEFFAAMQHCLGRIVRVKRQFMTGVGKCQPNHHTCVVFGDGDVAEGFVMYLIPTHRRATQRHTLGELEQPLMKFLARWKD